MRVAGTLGVVAVVALAGATGCTTTTPYQPSREIASSIPKDAAAAKLREQIEVIISRGREEGFDPLSVQIDADGIEVTSKGRASWTTLSYSSRQGSQGRRCRLPAVRFARLRRGRHRW